jgi:hypothetical protein
MGDLLLYYEADETWDGFDCPSGRGCQILADIWADGPEWLFSSPNDLVVLLMLAGY